MRLAYALALFVPVAIVLRLANASDTAVFFTSAAAIVPMAALMGKATEEVAAKAGPGIGGLLNVTFGNAPELIIAIFALIDGLHEVVKASIAGSILSNVLLVLGASMVAGGVRAPVRPGRRFREQTFDRSAAHAQSAMLLLAVIALLMPVAFELARGGHLPGADAERPVFAPDIRHLSLAVAIVLIASYALGMLFSLKTHRELFNPYSEEQQEYEGWPFRLSVGALAVSGGLVGVLSEIMVGSIKGAAHEVGLSEFFIGVVVVAIAGNAAEHWVAVAVAWKQDLSLAINIAIGSAAQVALLVAPVLAVLSFMVASHPMALVFNGYETAALVGAVLIANWLTQEGRSNWYDGVLLLGLYVVFVLVFAFA